MHLLNTVWVIFYLFFSNSFLLKIKREPIKQSIRKDIVEGMSNTNKTVFKSSYGLKTEKYKNKLYSRYHANRV